MAKAHKNPIFVLGDGCRELSSATTSPAGCIWQQYARQQIAATYHATCPVHAAGHTTVSKQPGYLQPLIPPLRYRQELLPGNLLPGILPCIPLGNYRKKLPPCATAGHTTVHTPGQPPHRAYYLALGPAPSGRVIRM